MLYFSLVCARFSRAGSPRRGNRGTEMAFFGAMVFLVLIWVCFWWRHRWIDMERRCCHSCRRPSTWCCTLPLGVLHAGLGNSLATVATSSSTKEMLLSVPLGSCRGKIMIF